VSYLGGDVNLYRYARNDPVNRRDVLGLSAVTADMVGKGGAALCSPGGPVTAAACYVIGFVMVAGVTWWAMQMAQTACQGCRGARHSDSEEGEEGKAGMAEEEGEGSTKKEGNLDSTQGESETTSNNKKKLTPRDDHAIERKQQATQGDTHRQVGDPNRTVQQGQEFIDTDTSYTVHVRGNKVVIKDQNGRQVTQFKNTRRNTQDRIRKGKWKPINN
jgi:hypothetical protein